MVLVGASLIVGAHVLNMQYSRHCECCDSATDDRTRMGKNMFHPSSENLRRNRRREMT